MTAPSKRKAKTRPKAGHPAGSAEHRRKLFIEALLSNGENVTQAALAAGFSPKSAASQGSRLLKNVKVRQALDSRRAEVAQAVGLSTERTLREVARLAYLDPRKFFHADGRPKAITELDDDSAAALAGMEITEVWEGAGENRIQTGVTKKSKLADKNAALEKAMKFHGLYERDNSQKVDPIAQLINELGRSALPVREDVPE